MPETTESINDPISTAHRVKHDRCPMNTELAGSAPALRRIELSIEP